MRRGATSRMLERVEALLFDELRTGLLDCAPQFHGYQSAPCHRTRSTSRRASIATRPSVLLSWRRGRSKHRSSSRLGPSEARWPARGAPSGTTTSSSRSSVRSDDDLGIARAVRKSSLGALLASDVPIEVQPQHWPRRDRLRAICGSYARSARRRRRGPCGSLGPHARAPRRPREVRGRSPRGGARGRSWPARSRGRPDARRRPRARIRRGRSRRARPWRSLPRAPPSSAHG